MWGVLYHSFTEAVTIGVPSLFSLYLAKYMAPTTVDDVLKMKAFLEMSPEQRRRQRMSKNVASTKTILVQKNKQRSIHDLEELDLTFASYDECDKNQRSRR